MTIGERIKTARSNAGLTQRALAEKSGMATGTVQQYELGKRQPRIEQLQKIADALDVDINYLVHGKTLQQFEQESIDRIKNALQQVQNEHRTRMNTAFDQLNPEGQAVAADQVENLTYNPKYQKKKSE